LRRKTGNALFLKEYNRRRILSFVREHKSISGIMLSKLSGLAPKSVYEICDGLIQDGYLYEASIGSSGGGRKPVMLSLRPDYYYSIGIDIDVGMVRAVLMDITSTVKFELNERVDGINYEVYLGLMVKLIKTLYKRNKTDASKLLGVGLSVPGLIDIDSKKLIMAPNLKWENKDLINDLKQHLSCNIFVENEAMSSAFCEKWLGECKNDKDFICINIKSGIGAGIYTCGKPYRGARGSAGEIGHIPLSENGPLCGCKNRGCLETLASTNALLTNAKSAFEKEITLDGLIALAQGKNKAAEEIFNNAAQYLGLAISFLVNTYNPSKIILGKDFTKYAKFELDVIIDKVNGTALKHNASAVRIQPSSFGERASVLGAAILPQIQIF